MGKTDLTKPPIFTIALLPLVHMLINDTLQPFIFVFIYVAHKLYYRTEIVPLRALDYTSLRADNDREPDPTKHGRLRKLFELRKPTPKIRSDRWYANKV
jgi:amino acid permease